VVEVVHGIAAARGVRLEYNAAPVPLMVQVDAAQIGEALRVLVQNALEAVRREIKERSKYGGKTI
jgi:nitrogen fixation/metabolism regulation signal transduction histidine kinase